MKKLSYKPLFKILVDKNMTNKVLMKEANISKSSFYKLKNSENVTTDILLRICNVLDCDISDIVECEEDVDK